MLEYISGVAEAVLNAPREISFRVEDGCLVSSLPGTDVRHTCPLYRATMRETGRVVGENMLAALVDG